jgi:hypothetical protein
MSARRTDEPPRWVGLQPAFTLAAVPDSVFGAEHPAPPLAVEDRKVAHSDPERPRLEGSHPPLLDQVSVTQLGFGERIDSHPESIAPGEGSLLTKSAVESASARGP